MTNTITPTSRAYGENQIIDADFVIYRLEEAGKCLLSMPGGRIGPAAVSAHTYGFMSEIVEGSGYVPRIKLATPDAATITRMDEAHTWLALIPKDRMILRRVVAALSLISPVTERRVYSIAKVAKAIGADAKAVENWRTQGIRLIVQALRAAQTAKAAAASGGAGKALRPSRAYPEPAVDVRERADAEWNAVVHARIDGAFK